MTIKLWKPEFHANKDNAEVVGINMVDLMREGEVVELEFTFTRKSDGTKKWPNKFYISRASAAEYPKEVFKGIRMVKIPLKDFKEAIPKQEKPIILPVTHREHDNIPEKPCHICKSTKFWKTSWGVYMCCICHPSPVEVKVLDITKKEVIK